ncbi:substrate-binding domain-containing protein [Kitasatospora sp. NPDC058170]|uniref:substrate-binding domain-containing protein n=1 Tax=Kitasatospora sp. NPDC058170 TaxID=3346364 RepID=UPI0036D803DD
MLRLAARVAPVLALASALALAAAVPALADPPVPIPVPPPAATDLVGVGAQVTDPLFNQFSTDYNATLAAAGDTTSPRLYSWDAIGPTTITPKTGASPIYRPYNSDAGIIALNATGTTTTDFARSARLPKTGDPASTLFVAMAKDAVSWAAPAGGNAPANLTTAQLRGIYTCTITNWRQISSALPDATIRPVLTGHLIVDRLGADGPATDSSGFFLQAINYYPTIWGDRWTDHSCVSVVERENQGTDALLHDPNAIVPYSVGRYIGQVYGGHTRPGDEPGALTVRNLNSVAPVNSIQQISGPFAASPYGRVLFNTVREAEWTGVDAHAVALRAVFGRDGWICRSGLPQIRSHGFLPLPSAACGSSTHS